MIKNASFLLCLVIATALVTAEGAKVHGAGQRAEMLGMGLKAVQKWLEEHKEISCDWQDSTLMIGVAALQQATGDPSLTQAMASFGAAHNFNLCVQLTGASWHADNQLCAATYAELYLNSPSEARNSTWVAATITQLDAEIAAASSSSTWNWVDALFMAMSVYARAGALTGKQAYFDKMHRNFVYSALSPHPNGYAFWSQQDALFYRDPPKGNPDGVFWSRGNGWAAAALVQALKYAPAEDPHTQTYRVIFRQHMDKLRRLQGPDGCWRASLLNPEFYPLPETTGTSLFTYAMAYGISSGLLDAETYLPTVNQAWSCLTAVSLHPDGTVGNCQPVGWAPTPDWGRDSSSSFCVGQFAMAASAVAQLHE